MQGDEQDAIVARASAEVEGLFYGKLARIEEVIEFAHRIGAKKLAGILYYMVKSLSRDFSIFRYVRRK